MNHISRILIANRGEIALRIIKACKVLGIQSVLAVSDLDRDSLPARLADRTICIGPAPPRESYLKIDTLIAAALGTNCNAIHPGYGFLAEQSEFARACEKQALTFIGPRSETIRQMGNKLLARKMAKELAVPVVPGSDEVKDFQQMQAVVEDIGLPLLVKAASGGGGRGMKIVTDSLNLKETFEIARQEAQSAFGDPSLYVERYIPSARHIEIQVLGDQQGTVIHLGERDCSLQRRYQKIIEEAPAYCLTDQKREQVRHLAVVMAGGIKYENAGTLEFILDEDHGQFYFMEMNTRIQVEHPVTEMVTGVDLVAEQILIADGQPLSLCQADVTITGHAIECRINAELADSQFQPSPGRIGRWEPAEGTGIRVDSHCYSGYFVPPYYDSLLAKVIASGKDRAAAIERMDQALDSFIISGVHTTIPFLQFLIRDRDFIQGRVNTRWAEHKVPEFQAQRSGLSEHKQK
ncbi:MAG: acetyl-CoA carboxylase biotin carboxylase subunit [Desulfobacterales bacterium]|nr:acetyl-CoA carboxylase biotin carboxylase subunit [Desulfobacterales bacterium]